MNPKLDTYFLHSLHGQVFGFHSLMSFLKARTFVNSFNSKSTITQILGPNYKIVSPLWKRDITFSIELKLFRI